MPWIDKKPVVNNCPHINLPRLFENQNDFDEGSIYACDDCGEHFVFLIKHDVRGWVKRWK